MSVLNLQDIYSASCTHKNGTKIFILKSFYGQKTSERGKEREVEGRRVKEDGGKIIGTEDS